LTLNKVLTHPDLKSTLLSVFRMTQSPETLGVWFTENGAEVFSKASRPPSGPVLLKGRQVNGVYQLDGMNIVPSSTPSNAMNAAPEAPRMDGALWHARLAHLSASGMEKLLSAGAVSGLEALKPADCHCGELCAGCIQGKAHRASFSKTPSERGKATRPLERVHADLTGPMQVDSLSGSQYLLVIVDEFSRKAFGFCIPTKGEAAGRIQEWVRAVTVQQGHPVAEFHSDGGGEFLSKELLEFFKAVGTTATITPPHTPQHNAIVERMMRTIVEPARAMLYYAGAPLVLWGEAMMAVIHVRNMVGVRKDSKLTPDMMWKPQSARLTVTHLRVWGCDAWTHVPKADRQKLDAKATRCIFLGYGLDGHGYRLYDVATRRVIHSRDVTFDEKRFTHCKVMRDDELVASDGTAVPRTDDEYYDFIQDSRFRAETKLMEIVSREFAEAQAQQPPQPVISAPPTAGVVDTEACSPAPGVLALPVAGLVPAVAPPDRAPAAAVQGPPPAAPEPERRYPVRGNAGRPPSRYGLVDLDDVGANLAVMAAKAAVESGGVPANLEMAFLGDWQVWMRPVHDELESLVKHGTMVPSELPIGRKAIDTRLLLGEKMDSAGEVARRKSRVVVRGFAQREGVDYNATFAPVLAYSSIRLHFAIVCMLDYELDAMDVKTAFLNAVLEEEVYITMPRGIQWDGKKFVVTGDFTPKKNPQVFRLIKSLYGIKQAPHDWNEEINRSILSLGYTRCASDSCMYVKRSRTGKSILLPLFVDDMFPAYHRDDRTEWEADKKALMAKYDMKDLGEAKLILGMRITRDRAARTLKADQEAYINRLLESCDMQDCIAVESPEDNGVKHSAIGRPDSSSSSKVDSAHEEAEARNIDVGSLLKLRYGSVVGSLLYAALSTRPDISHAVSTLAQFVSAPLPQHWEAAMRVLRYLKGTSDLGLIYRGRPSANRGAPILGPCYSDSNWGGDPDDRKSRTGVVCKINGCAVSWKSQKQTVVALSSAEAEYMAAGEAVKEILWLRQLLMELGFAESTSTSLLVDNEAAISIANKDVFHNRTKHIDMRHHFIRAHVQSNAVAIEWVSTHEQEADLFTKALGKHPFLHLRERIMGLVPQQPAQGTNASSKSLKAKASTAGDTQGTTA
jgi:hypothetical protein